MSSGIVLKRPGTLVLLQSSDPETGRRLEALVREHGGRLSPLQAGTLVRKIAGLAPLRCACGCGRLVSADEAGAVFERGAVLS